MPRLGDVPGQLRWWQRGKRARGSAAEAAKVAQGGLAIVRKTEFTMWLPKFEDIARDLLRWQRQPAVRAYLEEFGMTKRQFAPSSR